MGQQVTHEITYLNKEDKVRVERVFGQEEADDIVTILDRNKAPYTIQDVRPNGTVSIPVQ